ncbi:MAG TPA: HD domain-containing protein, partial [Tenuifilaceae bacterium]|nr:HD domain-containing protein [Tenuifilaceae bacterium]
MDNDLQQVYQSVKFACRGDSTGHDWWHILRVVKLALFISERENANPFTVELAALLHDVDDWKLNRNTEGCPVALRILHDSGYSDDEARRVALIIGQV